MSNPSTYFLGSSIVQKPAPASVPSTTPPVFAGINAVSASTDGSIIASWLVGSTVNPPIAYKVYIAEGLVTAGALFVSSNLAKIVPTGLLSARLFTLKDQTTYLLKDQVYTLGVRAIDAYNNTETNTAILTATSLGIDAEPMYEIRGVFTVDAANYLLGTIWVTQDSENYNTSLGTASYVIKNSSGVAIGISETGITATLSGSFIITPVLATLITGFALYTVEITVVVNGDVKTGRIALVTGEL